MTIGSILLGLALLIIVVMVLVRPIILHAHEPAQAPPTTRQQLLAHKESLLLQIRDLDFDRETKKLPEEVYEAQRAQLVAEAAAVLKQLDALSSADDPVFAEIETAVSRKRQQPAPSNGKARFCSHCGQPVDPNDNFCAQCGNDVRLSQSATETA